jgi:hypothetical protein
MFTYHMPRNLDNKGGTPIASVYVDDLMYIGNDVSMMIEFRDSMKREFAMIDLGKMRCFLEVEVIQ